MQACVQVYFLCVQLQESRLIGGVAVTYVYLCRYIHFEAVPIELMKSETQLLWEPDQVPSYIYM